jgi:glycerol uptake facilitator-like aquaporin
VVIGTFVLIVVGLAVGLPLGLKSASESKGKVSPPILASSSETI